MQLEKVDKMTKDYIEANGPAAAEENSDKDMQSEVKNEDTSPTVSPAVTTMHQSPLMKP